MDKLRCDVCGSPLILLAVTTTELRADFISKVENAENLFALEFSKNPVSTMDWHIVCANPLRKHRQHRLEVDMEIEELADVAYLPSIGAHQPNRISGGARAMGFIGQELGDPEWQDFSSRGYRALPSNEQQVREIPLPELRRKPREPKGASNLVLSEPE